jgi:hypothetical protein
MRMLITAAALALASVAKVEPQQPTNAPQDTTLDTRLLPSEIEREVTEIFNAVGTRRATGPLTIDSSQVESADVAVLNGPLIVFGRVTGRIVAINSDVVLKPGARVEGTILVVGGSVIGKEDAFIGGDVRVYRQLLAYRRDGDRLIAAGSSEEDVRWWKRRDRWRTHGYSEIRFASARTYNRVEGLPLYLGPSFARNLGWGRFSVDAFGVLRTSDRLVWNGDNVGHSVKAELKVGYDRGFAVGGKLFDIVDAVEPWQLSDTEVGLGSFLLHRDFRDYFGRHGGSGYVSFFPDRAITLTASLSDQLWASRTAHDPYSLFRNADDWRENPLMDEGRFRIANFTLQIDTRNDYRAPWTGWYLIADVEHGSGELARVAATSTGVRDVAPGPSHYQRGFLDLRRYNRVSPEGQLNIRLVAGGWLGGDPLPLERRFSLGGPGTLPGFDFRSPTTGTVDNLQCGGALGPLGMPAQCDRMLLGQIEYRGDVSVRLFDDFDRSWSHEHWSRDFQWVLFADAGRGWLVGPGQDGLHYQRDDLPALDSFRTDVGLGFDFGLLGVYAAKAVSDSKEPVNLFVRLHRRF